MKEIVTLCLGQCGVANGCELFKEIAPAKADEGQSDAIEHSNTDVYFRQVESGPIGRVLLVDTDPALKMTHVANSTIDTIAPSNVICGEQSAHMCWSAGHCTHGAEIFDSVLDAVRLEVEACDNMQGFQIMHSMGGGTGGGSGSYYLQALRDQYPSAVLSTFSIVPTTKVSDSVVEPYNVGMTLRRLVEFADICHVFDNGVLHDLCTQELHIAKPTLEDLNNLICPAMYGTMAPLRQSCCDLRTLVDTLVPIPALHFVGSAFAPLAQPADALSLPELTAQLLSGRHATCQIDAHRRRHLACSLTYVGDHALVDIETYLRSLAVTGSAPVPAAAPKVVSLMPSRPWLQGTALINTVCIGDVWAAYTERYAAMWKRKAFVMWYTGEGMDECEFSESLESIQALVTEYRETERTMAVSSEAATGVDK